MQINDSIEFNYKVSEKDSAKSIAVSEGDQFPDVLSTSRMIALMEVAAARLMKPVLDSDELSVGVNVNVDHLAATPVGETVTVGAKYIGMKGKFFHFEVTLEDNGAIAGKGEHTRAVVDPEKLLAKASKGRNRE